MITKSVWAGASKYTHDMAIGLPKDDFDVFLAAGNRDVMAQKIISADIPYFEIKAFQRDVNIFKDIFAFFEILSLLFKIKPDIVHVSSAKAGGVAGAAIFVYRILRRFANLFLHHGHKGNDYETNLRIFFTVHGWTFNENRPGWQIVLIKFFSKLTCLFYDEIICVSDHDYKAAIENKIAPAKKLTVIHNGIKPEEYIFLSAEEARKKFTDYGLPANDYFLVGTIGEFTKNKGQKFLIEAMKKIQPEFSAADKLKIVMIGFDGGEKSKLESKIKNYELSDRIFLIDNLPGAAKYLKAFDIFVLPSLKEGLPYTLFEAGLAELPIIATDVGGIPEIIENEKSGLLVSPANPEELTKAINKLGNNALLRQSFGRQARQKILQEFSFEKMLEKTLDLYK